jgi:hypothetical protein
MRRVALAVLAYFSSLSITDGAQPCALTTYQTCGSFSPDAKYDHPELPWDELQQGAGHFDVRYVMSQPELPLTVYVRGCGKNKDFHVTLKSDVGVDSIDFFAIPLTEDSFSSPGREGYDFVVRAIYNDVDDAYLIFTGPNYAQHLYVENDGAVDFFARWEGGRYRWIINRIVQLRCANRSKPSVVVPPWDGE